MADAFVKAKANAAELAAAAGVELGSLAGLSGNCSGQSSMGENEYGGYNPMQSYYGRLRRMMAQQGGGEESDGKQDEAVSAEPAALTFTCYVTASFGLK